MGILGASNRLVNLWCVIKIWKRYLGHWHSIRQLNLHENRKMLSLKPIERIHDALCRATHLMPIHVQECWIQRCGRIGIVCRSQLAGTVPLTDGRWWQQHVSVGAVLAHQHLHGHTFCGIQHGHLMLLNLFSLCLVSPILKPDFNLCLG